MRADLRIPLWANTLQDHSSGIMEAQLKTAPGPVRQHRGTQGLTHSLDLTKEGLAVHATRYKKLSLTTVGYHFAAAPANGGAA